MTTDIEAQDLPAHVAACSVRYQGINGRLGRIERIIIKSAGWLIAGAIGIALSLAAVAWKLSLIATSLDKV